MSTKCWECDYLIPFDDGDDYPPNYYCKKYSEWFGDIPDSREILACEKESDK